MIGKILKSPITILASVILGILFGLYEKNIALSWGIIGDVYLNLFQMTVIPILVTSIVASLAKLMQDSGARQHIKVILLTFLIMLASISLFGTLSGLFARPGSNLGESTTAILDKIIKNSVDTSRDEMALYDITEDLSEKPSYLVDFFVNIVPSNIFKAFSNGIVLQLVFFSIIFGVAIGFIENDSSNRLINGVSSLKDSFQKLINWTMYALPIGLIFLMGKQIAQVGVEILLAMVKFIVVFYIAGIIVMIACSALIWAKSGIKNPLDVIKKLLDPIIICFATRNSFAALPSSVFALKGLGFNANMVDLVFPLGLTVLRFGNIMYFAIASCFVSQIYDTALSLPSIVLVVVGSLLAGTATAGASGLLTLPMISLILDPIGLPVESILIVFMAIDSLIDPMRTLLIVYVNIATTALVSSKQDNTEIRKVTQKVPQIEKKHSHYITTATLLSAKDSVTAFFGVNVKTACKAALSDIWAKPQALHTGEIRVEHGEENKKADYTLLGNTMEIAKYLEEIANRYKVKIVASPSTYDLVKDDFDFRILDKIKLHGKTFFVYELLAEKNAIAPELLKAYKTYEKGLQYYFAGEWDYCITYMNVVIKSIDDMAAKAIKARAEAYKAKPPKNWSGTYEADKQ